MDWDSSSSSSSDSDYSASSESTAPSAALSYNQVATGASDTEPIDDGATDFPFDFATDINDQANGGEGDYVDDGNGATGSLPSTLTPRKQQMISSSLPMFQQEFTNTNMTSQGNITTRE